MTTSREAIAKLFNDSVSVIVSARPLNAEERDVAKRANLIFGEFKIAIDGIAVIVNNANPVRQFRTTQIDSILNGYIKNWDKAGWTGSFSPIAVCFPDRNTGTFDSLSLYTKHDEQQMRPAKITASSMEMIRFVSQYEHAIGFVGVNWYSSYKDSVRALALNDPGAADSLGIKGKYFGPHQAYMYQKFYPLIKDVYIYTTAGMYGVGSGFASFITSSAGQKIILNSGLVPATMPVRLVEITNRSL
jgi:phosphate transport system substrate-binding protein